MYGMITADSLPLSVATAESAGRLAPISSFTDSRPTSTRMASQRLLSALDDIPELVPLHVQPASQPHALGASVGGAEEPPFVSRHEQSIGEDQWQAPGRLILLAHVVPALQFYVAFAGPPVVNDPPSGDCLQNDSQQSLSAVEAVEDEDNQQTARSTDDCTTTPSKPFACTKCDKCFSTKSLMTRHCGIHEEKKHVGRYDPCTYLPTTYL